MKPGKSDTANVKLTLPGGTEKNDLHAEKCQLITDGEAHPGFETVWITDAGERRALANGAPVILHVWGAGHPPVAVKVGDPDEDAIKLHDEEHVGRALGWMYGALIDPGEIGRVCAEHGVGDGIEEVADIAPSDWIQLWERALEETREAPRDMADIPVAEHNDDAPDNGGDIGLGR